MIVGSVINRQTSRAVRELRVHTRTTYFLQDELVKSANTDELADRVLGLFFKISRGDELIASTPISVLRRREDLMGQTLIGVDLPVKRYISEHAAVFVTG